MECNCETTLLMRMLLIKEPSIRSFYDAFAIFDNQSIEKSLICENPLVRIFALLDRRLGKCRLLALEETIE